MYQSTPGPGFVLGFFSGEILFDFVCHTWLVYMDFLVSIGKSSRIIIYPVATVSILSVQTVLPNVNDSTDFC